MGQFDAGSIIGTLDVNRSPFTQGLELAKSQGADFEKKKLIQNVDVNTGDSIPKLMALRAAADAAAGGGAAGGAAAAGGGGLAFLGKAALLLAPALAPLGTVVAGLGAGLVGLGATVGVGAGAFMAAAKPMFGAISSITQAQTAYNNAVATYGPKSAQAATALKQLNDQIKQSTPAEQAAAKAWESFTASYKTWAQSFEPTILPVLTSGLTLLKTVLTDITPVVKGMTSFLGSFIQQFQGLMTSPVAINFFKFIGTELSKLGPILGGTFANLLSGLMSFIQAAAPLINIVAGWLLQVSTIFAKIDFQKTLAPLIASFEKLAPIVGNFLGAVMELVGTLLKAIAPIGVAMFEVIAAAANAFLPVIKAIGMLLAMIAPIIANVAVAFTQLLANALKAVVPVILALLPIIWDLVNLMGGALIAIFHAVGPAIDGILGVFAKFLQALADIFLSPAIQNGIKAFLADISPLTFVFAPIGQAIGQLAPVFGNLAVAIGNVAGPIAEIIGQFLSLGGTVLEHLVPVLVPLVGNVLTALVKVLQDLSPYLPVLAQLFGQTVLDIVTSLAGPLAQVVNDILPVLASTIQQLAPYIPTLAQLFSQALINAVRDIAPVLPQVVGALSTLLKILTPVVASTLGAIAKAFSAMPGPMQAMAFGLIAAKTPLFNFLPGMTGLKSVLSGGWGMLKSMGGWIKSVATSSALASAATRIWTGIQAAFNLVMDANPIALIVLGLAALVAIAIVVYKNWDTLVSFFKHAWKDMKQWFEDGVKWVVNLFKGPWGNAILGAISVFMPFIGLPLLVIKNWGVISGFFKGLFDGIWNDIKSWGDTIINFFTSLPSTLASIGAHLWDWLLDGFKAIEHGVADIWNNTIGSLSFHLPSWIPGIGGDGFSMPKIPLLDTGGIVTGPTMAMLSKNSVPEAVVPLSDHNPFLGNPQKQIDALNKLAAQMQRSFDALLAELKKHPEETGEAVGKVVGNRFTTAVTTGNRQLIEAVRKG